MPSVGCSLRLRAKEQRKSLFRAGLQIGDPSSTGTGSRFDLSVRLLAPSLLSIGVFLFLSRKSASCCGGWPITLFCQCGYFGCSRSCRPGNTARPLSLSLSLLPSSLAFSAFSLSLSHCSWFDSPLSFAHHRPLPFSFRSI
jgi:hypothetical protein